MTQNYQTTSQPASEPVTYAQAADHLLVDSDDDETYITALISVARRYLENATGRVGIQSTMRMTQGKWANHSCGYPVVELRRSPLVSVTSVSYYPSGSEVLTTLDAGNYRVITNTTPPSVQVYQNLPALEDRPDAVQVVFVAGHASSATVDQMMIHAIKLMVGHLYENRYPVNIGGSIGELPFSLRCLIENLKISGMVA